jgi:hypothetical protein
MIPVKIVPRIRGGRIKENSGGGEFKYDILTHCKHLCKWYNVPPTKKVYKYTLYIYYIYVHYIYINGLLF